LLRLKGINLMKIELELNEIEGIVADALIVPVFKDEGVSDGLLERVNRLTGGTIASLSETGEIKDKKAELTYVHLGKKSQLARLVLAGVGERDKLTPSTIGRIAGAAVRLMRSKRIVNAAILARIPDGNIEPSLVARVITESALLALYEQDKYQRKKPEDQFTPERLSILFVDGSPDQAAIRAGIERGSIVAEATNFSRDLCVEPGSTLTPREFARRAEQMALSSGLEFESFDEPKLEEMGMGAILAVSRGSTEPAQLIIMRYRAQAAKDSRPIIIVGKGITFDSGGICIKPRDGMWEMKMDMAGGAAVVGTMHAIAKLRPAVNVIGLVPSSENLPSGNAYKPGDVLKAYSGKTIEVIDTDAEGRLVLADALHYATEQNPSCIIDLATLTGACVVALGTLRAAILGTDRGLLDELRAASERAGEKLWPLPLDDDYSEMIKSDIADIKNLGGRGAGTITAAAFLREFVGDYPWAHLDIAGTAWQEENRPELGKGPTGFGVRTLVEFILSRANRS
jgi:leucyl aminopeptidase